LSSRYDALTHWLPVYGRFDSQLELWMAKSLAQIQKQIAKLQQEADTLKAKEVPSVVARIKDAIAHYGLTIEHLFDGKAAKAAPATKTTAKPAKVARKAGAKRPPVPVKFRDDAGNTWTGRGNRPRWLVAALATGKKIDDFAVKR
jgi:DNA-binding protein H-NS